MSTRQSHPSMRWLRATRAALLTGTLALLAFAAGAADAPDMRGRPSGDEQAAALSAAPGNDVGAAAQTTPDDTAADAKSDSKTGAAPDAKPDAKSDPKVDATPDTKSGAKTTAKADTPVDAERLFNAIVKVSVRAVPDARSNATLGSEREGTGVVIGDDGLVLTIGYLIVEADDVKVTDAHGRTLPAQVVGYDHNSGFGLIRTMLPLDAAPVRFGDSTRMAEKDPVLIASAGDERAAFAYIVSKRAFTGNWEYELDSAIYTSPPTLNWSGAALIDRDGKLIGIGSLIVREATDGDPKVPGNVFVPIDLLKPILTDLVREGHRTGLRGRGLACRPTRSRDAYWSRACRPTGPPIRPACNRATSSSRWATTPYVRSPSSISGCGRADAPATRSP